MITRAKTIYVPTLYFNGWLALAGRKAKLDRVASEDEVNNWIRVEGDKSITPDLIGFIGSRPLLIEIAVTHACDEEKIRKIKAYNEAAVEIILDESLSAVGEVEEAIFSGDNVKWLHNPNAEKHYNARRKRVEEDYAREGCELVPFDWAAYCELEDWDDPEEGRCKIFCRFARMMRMEYETSGIAEIPIVREILEGGRWNGKCYPKQKGYPKSKLTFVVYVNNREVEVEEWLADVLEELRRKRSVEKHIHDCRTCEFHEGLFEDNVVCSAPQYFSARQAQ